MSYQKKKPSGCGCLNIPISVILLLLGGGCWLFFTQKDNLAIGKLLPNNQKINIPFINQESTPRASSIPTPKVSLTSIPKTSSTPTPSISTTPIPNPKVSNQKTVPKTKKIATAKTPQKTSQTTSPKTPWEKKAIRGIYISRYHITNRTNEQTIRQRVRHYRSQGFNTIIHGVWGNGCTMYNSEVMQKILGNKSCPNKFRAKWLDWLIDEAHKQGMEVHAYFEKGIKIDKNSPIFDLAISRKWIVPGIDKTYDGIDHYVLDVEIPEVANFFKDILVEFVKKYPKIDAVQWDDYLGYHAELPGKVDRTGNLTSFSQNMIKAMKQANPNVSFDICHHNPYWAKRYFAADWEKWGVDRVFIQNYSEKNFDDELNYVKKYDGIAITERQFHRFKDLVNDKNIKSILIFPLSGKPEETASKVKDLTQKIQSN
ncbi:MAG: family 10 glycosylhydrolase [Cyanobacteria bacterium P01_A01_bin.84]